MRLYILPLQDGLSHGSTGGGAKCGRNVFLTNRNVLLTRVRSLLGSGLGSDIDKSLKILKPVSPSFA